MNKTRVSTTNSGVRILGSQIKTDVNSEISQKHSKKVLIIGLDGLEYNLVEKFDLKNLKQIEHGKVDLSKFSVLSTPVIWASFITGLPPEKHGVKVGRGWKNPFIHFLYEKLALLSHNIGLHKTAARIYSKMVFIKQGRKTLEIFGFRPDLYHGKDHYRKNGIKTIFDLVDNSISLHVPTYCTQEEFMEKLRSGEGKAFRDAFDSPHSRRVFEEKFIWEAFRRDRRDCITALGSDWRLLLAYFEYTDYIGHLFWGNLTKMWEGYAMADKLVAELKHRINEDDTLLLVISDHGMEALGKYGFHSDHAFYSANKRLGLTNPKMTDFFRTISEWLGYE